MGLHISTRIWAIPGLPPTSRLVLLCLATFGDADGTSIHPSIATISDRCGLSRRTISRELSSLEASGLIRATSHRLGGGRSVTHWRIAVETSHANVALFGRAGMPNPTARHAKSDKEPCQGGMQPSNDQVMTKRVSPEKLAELMASGQVRRPAKASTQ